MHDDDDVLAEVEDFDEERYVPPREASLWMTIAEARVRLDEIADEEAKRYEQCCNEREAIEPQREPEFWHIGMSCREAEIRAEVAERTAFSNAEKTTLEKLDRDQRSWNPLVRVGAKQQEAALVKEQQRRHDEALSRALASFREHEVPGFIARGKKESLRYQAYETHVLDLEDAISNARYILRQGLPELERDLNVIERSGVKCLVGVGEKPNFELLSIVISEKIMDIPAEIRMMSERGIDREWKHNTRVRAMKTIEMN